MVVLEIRRSIIEQKAPENKKGAHKDNEPRTVFKVVTERLSVSSDEATGCHFARHIDEEKLGADKGM